MKLTIVHLFYDLMNLYGESGNVLALEKALTSQGIDIEIKYISINDSLDLQNVDIIYIGAGTESNQLIVLDYLKKYKEEINQAFLNNKFFIVTGNAIELFGKYIVKNNEEIEALNMFDYISTKSKNRIVSECIFNFEYTNEKILGFENHECEITGIDYPLFTVEKGYGSNNNSKVEGIFSNNFYGTYLIGPILARNPEFLQYISTKIILSKYSNFDIKPFDFKIEKKAHENFIKKYNL